MVLSVWQPLMSEQFREFRERSLGREKQNVWKNLESKTDAVLNRNKLYILVQICLN